MFVKRERKPDTGLTYPHSRNALSLYRVPFAEDCEVPTDGMSVLIDNDTLKDKVIALQKKVIRLESELTRVHARLQVLEGVRGAPRGAPRGGPRGGPRLPKFGADGEVVGEGEDVQCAIS